MSMMALIETLQQNDIAHILGNLLSVLMIIFQAFPRNNQFTVLSSLHFAMHLGQKSLNKIDVYSL